MQPPEQRDQGIPPNWVSYINVDDVDETSRLAREAGGSVVVEPRDVAGAGRMSAILDTHGAGFCIWEPRKHFGAGIVNEPGAMSWNELRSPDPKSVQNFYTQLFGWSYQETDMGGGLAYVGVNVGGKLNGGMILSQVMGPTCRRIGASTSRSRTRTRRWKGPRGSEQRCWRRPWTFPWAVSLRSRIPRGPRSRSSPDSSIRSAGRLP